MTRSTKIVVGVIGGLAIVFIVGNIVAGIAIDHSSTTRNAKAIEAARPTQTNDQFCWLHHAQLDQDPAADPVELANAVLAGKANDHSASLGVYAIASGRPPEALEPSFDAFTTMVLRASRNKPVDRYALLQASQQLHDAIAHQCTPEHSTTSIGAASPYGGSTVSAAS